MSTSCRINFFVYLFALIIPAAAQSQQTASSDFFDESPIILTATRMSKPMAEAPASVSVIDRQMIESSGLRQLADLFRLVPGFIVGYHNGNSPAVTYHGLGQEFARQIQVLIDGRSVFIPSFGGVPWSNLPLLIEDIERIEIIRGPDAVSYGTNAFLASINIITRHAAEDQGTLLSLTSSDNAHPDIKDAYLRVGSHHEALDWRLSLGVQQDQGFAAINDSSDIAKLNLRGDVQGVGNQFWTFQLGTSNSTAGRGNRQTENNQTDLERDEEARNSYFNMHWEAVSENSSSNIRLTHSRQSVTDAYDPGPFTFAGFSGVTTFIDFNRVSERSDLEISRSDELDEDLRLLYGGSFRKDRVKSLFLLNDNAFHEVDTGRLFGGLEWRIDPDWLLDLGVMLEDSSLTSRQYSPRLSLIRKLDAMHSLRFVASSARRNPILWESEGETEFNVNVPPMVIIPTWQGNPEIKPEKIKSYEIGLYSQFKALKLSSDVKLFNYEITQHIMLTSIPVATALGSVNVGTTKNEGSTQVSGVEARLDFAPTRQLDLQLGASLLDVDSSNALLEDSYADKIAFFNISYRIASRNEISAFFYYIDAMSWLDSSADIPITRRLDLRYAFHLDRQTRVELIGQNLLEDNSDYELENVHDQVVYLRLIAGF